jgi:chorismate mutase/prephenate dehydratase
MNLQDVRIKIDAIDQELVRLLNERADMVNLVGEIKHREGLDIYAPEREERSCCASSWL